MAMPNIKPDAKTFLDWAIGQSVIAEYGKFYPITAYDSGQPIPEGFPADPVNQLAENDFDWAAKNRNRILDEWTKRYDAKSEAK